MLKSETHELTLFLDFLSNAGMLSCTTTKLCSTERLVDSTKNSWSIPLYCVGDSILTLFARFANSKLLQFITFVKPTMMLINKFGRK